MSFASRITRVPLPHDAAIGAEAAAAFDADLRPLLNGAAGCAPYLAGLIAREREWLGDALGRAPEAVLQEICADIADLAPASAADRLRQAKRRAALLIALADLGGVWTLHEVTGALTQFADASVDAALRVALQAQMARNRLPKDLDLGRGGGAVAFAMGKMGAGELNYSSDIDLIMLFDETQFDGEDLSMIRAGFVRATRAMCALLSDITGEGYVFRTDLRLRPDPSVTPVCLSMDAAERYYESVGRAWERAAWIKARPAAGDIAAGERFLENLRPFVWRRHLDFAAIADTHDMRRRIKDAKGLHGAPDLDGFNIKLGAGGIREIEFFTQTRQLIAGGRDPSLRVRGTCEGLARLAAAEWVEVETAERLSAAYIAHREVEHRLQMVADAQTHSLPNNADGFDRLARFLGQADTDAFRTELSARLKDVSQLAEDFFAPGEAEASVTPLAEDPEIRAVMERWPGYPALRSARATEIFARVRTRLFERLDRAANPGEAIWALDAFLAGLPAGVQVFSLFEANPQLIDLLVDIAATAPRLAKHLSRNARVFDAVIGGAFFGPWPGVAGLRDSLAATVSDKADYEARLDATRAWMKEWHFRIGVHHLRGLMTASEAGRAYADLAEAVVSGIWPVVVDNFAHRHGPPPGRGASVLAMGSVGAGQLGAASDLDLIVIYDPLDADVSEGPRPLVPALYYGRLTKALVTALSAPMAEGKLYEVDMRLRPSGKQGPVATSFSAFRSYQTNDAWTWEHLALTRARPIAGDASLGADIAAFRQEVLALPHDPDKIVRDVADMRARIAAAKSGEGAWDTKIGAGRMQDIELLASAATLIAGAGGIDTQAQLANGHAIGWWSEDTTEALRHAYQFLWRLRAATGLLSDGPLDTDTLGTGARDFILRETAHGDIDALTADIDRMSRKAAALVEAALTTVPKAMS